MPITFHRLIRNISEYFLCLISLCSGIRMFSNFNKIHNQCRKVGVPYPRTENIFRLEVPDDKVSWDKEFLNYKPIEFTHNCIKGQDWADQDVQKETSNKFKWNGIDGKINRVSYNGKYSIDENTGRPKNPFGRTGLSGRGSLGRWGPNHAADPIVTRWLTENGSKVFNKISKKPILEFITIKRKYGGAWALPGGMVDLGEDPKLTARREFSEEALNCLNWTDEQKQEANKLLDVIFSQGQPVYQGYVDDARNTDNAWMETVAFLAHDETGENVGKLNLCSGDDAVDVRWMQADEDITLFANHRNLVQLAAEKLNAHWTGS